MLMASILPEPPTSTTYGAMIDSPIWKESSLLNGAAEHLARVQRADRQNKAIIELRPEFKEPEFPGFLHLIAPLSQVAAFPESWIEILKHATGVYLLTCPRTKEQYVGSAYGTEEICSRWMGMLPSRPVTVATSP